MLITETTPTALGDHKFLQRFGQIGKYGARFVVIDDGAHRDIDIEGAGRFARRIAGTARLTVFGLEVGGEFEGDQRGEIRFGAKADIAAPATITTIGSAFGDVLFAAEGHGAVAAIAGFDKNSRLIDEHGDFLTNERETIARSRDLSVSVIRADRHKAAGQSRKSFNFLARLGWRSLRSALASIWRMRSRVTPNSRPTSSKVRLRPSSRPNRSCSTRRSRPVSESRTSSTCSFSS